MSYFVLWKIVYIYQVSYNRFTSNDMIKTDELMFWKSLILIAANFVVRHTAICIIILLNKIVYLRPNLINFL